MTLYLVPTPLGNLEDITPRAVQALRSAKAVYCEDTRRTRGLLTHFGVHAPALRYDEHDERGVDRVLERLRSGEDLALVSDAGTPVVSDPGLRLVSAARREGLSVVSLPGPSAVAAAVAGSGLPGDSFVFLGFLPRAEGKRRRALESAAALGRTIVVYESPFRVVELLETIVQALGTGASTAVVRELSKVYEEWVTGTAAEVLERLRGREKLLGEFVVLAHPPAEKKEGTTWEK